MAEMRFPNNGKAIETDIEIFLNNRGGTAITGTKR